MLDWKGEIVLIGLSLVLFGGQRGGLCLRFDLNEVWNLLKCTNYYMSCLVTGLSSKNYKVQH